MGNILDGIDDFDEESKRMLRGSRIIQFAELEKGISGNAKDPLKGIRTNKTFAEISNDYALSSPFGKNSTFYKPTTDDYDALSQDFYTGGINYELLAKDLKEKLGLINDFLFEPEKYLLEDKNIYSGSSSIGIPIFSPIKNNKPFVYKKGEQEVQAIFDLAKLNVTQNLLSNSYNFGVYFDNYKVTYNLNFIYKDGEDKKFQDTETRQTSNPTEFKLNDEYVAIKLYTSNVDTFIEFLRIVFGNSDAELVKKSIIRYYRDFFATAKSNPDSIDALYENIPDFVLAVLTDEMLWKDFVSLSEKTINSSGTNENLSIINLLKGVKNANWWYNQINKSPEVIRSVLSKFSKKYIDRLIIALTKIGIKQWRKEDYQSAFSYSLKMDEEKVNGLIDSRIAYWCGFMEKEKKFEVGFSQHHYRDGMWDTSLTLPVTLAINSAFTPLKIIGENQEYYLPSVVANYFTEEQLDEDQSIILNNIASGLLPEFEAAIARGVAILSRISSGRKIKTVEELIEFLRKIDQNVMAEDLEKVGIEALFRGTTRNINGEVFSGNINTIEYGASTSTDPIRAIIFGIESSSKPGTKGVLQIYVPKDLKGLNLQSANQYRFDLELEVIVNTSPENLSNFAIKEIPIEDARKLVEEVYGVSLDTRITTRARADELLLDTKKLTLKESLDFYKKMINFKKQ